MPGHAKRRSESTPVIGSWLALFWSVWSRAESAASWFPPPGLWLSPLYAMERDDRMGLAQQTRLRATGCTPSWAAHSAGSHARCVGGSSPSDPLGCSEQVCSTWASILSHSALSLIRYNYCSVHFQKSLRIQLKLFLACYSVME